MSITLTIDSIDMSDYLVNDLSIEADEGRSVVASFQICDSGKLLDHDDLNGGAVIISYSGTLLFTGKIRSAGFDPFTRLFDFEVTDLLEDIKKLAPSFTQSDLFHVSITGTVEFDAADKTKVHGTNTSFTSELRVGQKIYNATDDIFGVDWEGTHTESNHYYLDDSSKTWVDNVLVGKTVYNTTDGSSGQITKNDSGSKVYVDLEGGANNLWVQNDTYRITPGFKESVSILSIESDTELTLSEEYLGTSGSGKACIKQIGLYFELINGKAKDTLELAVKTLDAEWMVLEVDKNNVRRISDCQAKQTPDVIFDNDNFLFHSVKMRHLDSNSLVNMIEYRQSDSYSITHKYIRYNDQTAIDGTDDEVLTSCRNTGRVGQWELRLPQTSSDLGSGPPYSFETKHDAAWTQNKRKHYPMIGFKSTQSIAKYGLKKAYSKIINLNYDQLTGVESAGSYTSTNGVDHWHMWSTHKIDPVGFTVKDVLFGLARSEMLNSHRLIKVNMSMAVYVDMSRNYTIQGSFPNIEFRGKVTKYRHIYNANTGKAITETEVAVIPPLI